MVKEYIRRCDCCGKIIENMYAYGVTSFYRDIRVGRGCCFKDYNQQLYNEMFVKTPNDYDDYSRGWKDDENKEFSFCSPLCVFNYFDKIYKDTYNNSVKLLKDKKLEGVDGVLDDLIKTKKGMLEKLKYFFNKSKSEVWIDGAIKEIKKFKKEIENKEKELKNLKQNK